MNPRLSFLLFLFLACLPTRSPAELLAGVARVDITDPDAGPVHDACHAKALVLKSGDTTAVLITIDAVAIGGIGRIGDEFLPSLRSRLERELAIPPGNVVVNASHCHGAVRRDLEPLVAQAVHDAAANLVPVTAGAGTGREDRISENRRLKMKDGSEADMRRAYSMPRDEDVAGVGPIDPEIGLLKLDRLDGRTLALLYVFACHPIMNPPHKGSSADFPGVSSRAIEDALGGGAVAFFVQGCCGDINPVRYKEAGQSPDAEPLGALLATSVLGAARGVTPMENATLRVTRDLIHLPRAADYERRIAAIEAEQKRALAALKPVNLNFKSFLPLLLEQKLWPDYPSHHSQSYLHDESLERDVIPKHDADNRRYVEAYLENIATMERLTRLNVNLALLKKHLAESRDAGSAALEVEICGLRVGDFKLVTFPGEPSVQVGLKIKQTAQDPHAFVAGYTNGYIYYTPTAEQRRNTGFAQEDCDTLVAPEWQPVFENKALDVLGRLAR